MRARSEAEALENRLRAIALILAAIGFLALTNGGHRASNLCLADWSWKTDGFYKQRAVELFAGSDVLKQRVGPAIAFARVNGHAATSRYIEAHPSYVIMGKIGHSEWRPVTFWDWATGSKAKIVSISRDVSVKNAEYYYASMDNCGA